MRGKSREVRGRRERKVIEEKGEQGTQIRGNGESERDIGRADIGSNGREGNEKEEIENRGKSDFKA